MKIEMTTEILRVVPVFTMEQVAECDPLALLRQHEGPRHELRRHELQPFYFASGRDGAFVFLGSGESDREKLDLARESLGLFDPASLRFDTQGLPLLMTRHVLPPDPQLRFRFTFEP